MTSSGTHDLVIAGAGPAGITAAIYASRKGMDPLVLTGDVGGQTNWGGNIENYTGFQLIKAPVLVARFEEHLRKYNITLKEQQPVLSVRKKGSLVSVETEEGVHSARSVIIATGKTYRTLDVPGEADFRGKGVGYCATCDAPFFTGKEVAVAGGGNSGFATAEQLASIASTVYILDKAESPKADEVLRERVLDMPNVRFFSSSHITRITGDKFVNGIDIVRSGEEAHLEVEGVFIAIGLWPNTGFESDLEKNERGELRVDNCNKTSIEGIFAAGDVTDVPHKQIIIASGEGAKAAMSAYVYLRRTV